jgi:hypothetical protein
MQAEAIQEHLATVRRQLDQVCERLVSPTPDALDGCCGQLESAVRQLAEWQPHLGAQAGNPAALEEAWQVRRSFLCARSLLRGAATFHGNWMQIRGAMSAGYTSQGEARLIGHTSRICLQA